VLSINAVVEALCQYSVCGDWKVAIAASLPKRLRHLVA